MRKIVLTFGLLAGAIVSVPMLLGMMLLEDGTINFDTGELLGYGSMIIASVMYAVTWETYYQSRPDIQASFMTNTPSIISTR